MFGSPSRMEAGKSNKPGFCQGRSQASVPRPKPYWWAVSGSRYSWRLDGETVIGHNGGDYGALTEMGFREDRVGFVVLMNSEGKNNTLANIEEAMMEAASSL